MASPAPAQPTPVQTQQNGNNRSPHVNGGQGDQQFKRNGRNPSHKKDYVAKRDNSNGNHDPRGERPRRRDRDENEVNSPVGGRNEEYRERRKGRNTREGQVNGNVNGTNGPVANGVNGNHAKAEAHSDQAKEASKPAPDHIDSAAEQLLVDELQEKFPHIPVDKIRQIIRKTGYSIEKSLHELESLHNKQPSPWIAVVKGGATKQDKPQVAPPANQQEQQHPAPRRDKRRDETHDQQSPHQQNHQQQSPHHPQQRRQPQQQYVHPHAQQHPHQAYSQQYPQNYQQYYQQVQPQPHPQQLTQEQIHEQQLAQQHAQQHAAQQHAQQQHAQQQQHVQQHALQPYQQPYPQPEVKGEDILNSLSKVIEHQLAEVQKKTEMLANLKNQLDVINNSDKDNRLHLEQKRAQLEADQQHLTEQLRNVTNELAHVEHQIKNAEDDKRHKIEDLYRNFQSNGVLAIGSS